MRCTKCGGALEAGTRFCGECGTPVTVVTPPPIAVPPAIAPDPAQQWVAPSPLLTTPPPAEAVPESRRGLFLGIGAAVVAGGAGVAYWRSRPKRLIVDASGSGDYRTIASAVLAARPADTIVLRPGTYKETLVINNDVQITGEGGRSKVIVEGAPGQGAVFKFTAGSATLTGLTIRVVGTGPADKGRGAIGVLAGTPVIEDCDLTSSAGSAVYILGAGANPVIRNCTMRNSLQGGVFVYEQGRGTIEKCVISGNGLSGVEISKGGNPTVRGCEIRDNKQVGVGVSEQGQGTIERCVISGNAYAGVAIRTGGNLTVRDCEVRGTWGITVRPDGLGTISGCDLTGATTPWWVEGGAKVTRTGNRPNA